MQDRNEQSLISREITGDDIESCERIGSGIDGYVVRCKYKGADEEFKAALRGGADQPEPADGYYFTLKIPKLERNISSEQAVSNHLFGKTSTNITQGCGIVYIDGDNGPLFGTGGALDGIQSEVQLVNGHSCYALACKFESCGERHGDIIKFVETAQRNSLESAFHKDLDITLAQMMYCAYLGIIELHEHDVLHFDIALRNLLASQSYKKNGIDVRFTAVVSDFGLAEIAPTGIAYNLSNTRPLRWTEAGILHTRTGTKISDLYSFRITLIEAMSLFTSNHTYYFENMVAGTDTTPGGAGGIATAIFVVQNGNEVALNTFSERARHAIGNDFANAFCNYISSPLLNEQEDYEYLLQSYFEFFQNAVKTRLLNLNDHAEEMSKDPAKRIKETKAFLVSMNRLMQPPISEVDVNILPDEDPAKLLVTLVSKLASHSLDNTNISEDLDDIADEKTDLELLIAPSAYNELIRRFLALKIYSQEQTALNPNIISNILTTNKQIEQQLLSAKASLMSQPQTAEIKQELKILQVSLIKVNHFGLKINLQNELNQYLQHKQQNANRALNDIEAAKMFRHLLNAYRIITELRINDPNYVAPISIQQEYKYWSDQINEHQRWLIFIANELSSALTAIRDNATKSLHPAAEFAEKLQEETQKIGSANQLKQTIQLCRNLLHSSDPQLVANGIEYLNDVRDKLLYFSHIQANYANTQGKEVDFDEVSAISVLHGGNIIDSNMREIMALTNDINKIDKDITKLSNHQKKLMERGSKPGPEIELPALENDNQLTDENAALHTVQLIYDEHAQLIAHAKALVNHFLTSSGKLKNDVDLVTGKILSPEERLLLEHFLKPYQVLASLPALPESSDNDRQRVLGLLFALMNQDEKYTQAIKTCAQNQNAFLSLVDQIGTLKPVAEVNNTVRNLVPMAQSYNENSNARIKQLVRELPQQDAEIQIAAATCQTAVTKRWDESKSAAKKSVYSIAKTSQRLFADQANKIRDAQQREIKQVSAALLKKVDALNETTPLPKKELSQLKSAIKNLTKRGLRANKSAAQIDSAKNVLQTLIELNSKHSLAEIEQHSAISIETAPKVKTAPQIEPAKPEHAKPMIDAAQPTTVLEALEALEQAVGTFIETMKTYIAPYIVAEAFVTPEAAEAAEAAQEAGSNVAIDVGPDNTQSQTTDTAYADIDTALSGNFSSMDTLSTSRWSLFSSAEDEHYASMQNLRPNSTLEEYVHETLDTYSSKLADDTPAYVNADYLHTLLIEMAKQMQETNTDAVAITDNYIAKILDDCPLITKTEDGKYGFQTELDSELKQYFLSQAVAPRRAPV